MATSNHDGYLLVGISNPETVEQLVPTAIDIANDRSLAIMLRNVVRVPPQVPLSEAPGLIEAEGEDSLEEARQRVAEASIPVDSSLRYARSVAKGLVGAAEEHSAELLLMGWHGRPPRRDIILGGHLDTVLRNAPCDILVKRLNDEPKTEVSSVLVPIAAGIHNELAVDLAASIARVRSATLGLVHVVDMDATDEEHARASELLEDARAGASDLEVTTEVIEHDDVVEAIVETTAAYDMTVLGATEQPIIRRKLVGTVSAAVGRDGDGQLMIAQRHPE